MSDLEVDVAIVGAGPVGALTANLLGGRGLRVAVFERERAPHGIPRAFSCDDEALRIYQQAGLADELLPAMHPCPEADFVDENGRSFAKIGFAGLDFGNGYSPLNFFHQPALEATLRRGLERFEQVRLALGHEVVALQQEAGEAGGATLTVKATGSGETTVVRAKYVLGCDGRKSSARRLAGIEYVGDRYEEPWIAISAVADEAPATMPLMRFVCDPVRPGMAARGAAKRLRFEFMLKPGETKESMERPEAVAKLMAPYVDPSKVRVERANLYTFEAKTASQWRKGRVFLLGDAAHTMPPFMGQGLVSGLRDAANLTWKLASVIEGRAGDALLDSYEIERRPHTHAMIETSRGLGAVFLVRNPTLAWLRASVLRAAGRIPRFHRFVKNMEFKPAAAYERGAFAGDVRRKGRFDGAPGVPPAFAEGTLFPQPRVATTGHASVLLDSVVGSGFLVLGRGFDPRPLASDAALWARLRTRFARVLPPGAEAQTEDDVIDTSGALGQWFDHYGADVVVVRPDHFAFGAARKDGFTALQSEAGRVLAPPG